MKNTFLYRASLAAIVVPSLAVVLTSASVVAQSRTVTPSPAGAPATVPQPTPGAPPAAVASSVPALPTAPRAAYGVPGQPVAGVSAGPNIFDPQMTLPSLSGGMVGGLGPMTSNPYGGVRHGPNGPAAAAPGIILFSQPETGMLDEMTADLRVMRHVLESAIGREFPEGGATLRMGIPMLLNSSAKPSEPVYLEGYGAVFWVGVNFPLLGPKPGEPAEAARPAEPDSEWERAKSELGGAAGQGFVAAPSDGSGISPAAEPAARYDADRIRKLRATLLRALRNAINLRHVKAEDWLSVTVIGAPDEESLAAIQRTAPGAVPTTWWGANRHTIMAIRVKKEDAQSVAEAAAKDEGGEILDQPLKSLTVATYYGPATAAVSTAALPGSPVRFSAGGVRHAPGAAQNMPATPAVRSKTPRSTR